jgi:hypothetical protein
MPKKTRKMKQRAAMRRMNPVDVQETVEEMPATEEGPVRMRPAISIARTPTPATFDYSHIYSDLKRIAFFAVMFFAVLVVLSFVIK